MKKPVVDYRTFRFNRINEPQFRHLWLLLGWVVYFALYFLTENLIPAERCRPMHMWLDDIIPFHEGFLIPYAFWYLLIVFSLGYFLLYNVDSFKRLQTFYHHHSGHCYAHLHPVSYPAGSASGSFSPGEFSDPVRGLLIQL